MTNFYKTHFIIKLCTHISHRSTWFIRINITHQIIFACILRSMYRTVELLEMCVWLFTLNNRTSLNPALFSAIKTPVLVKVGTIGSATVHVFYCPAVTYILSYYT